MNKDDAAQYLPLVQAMASGKTIQFNYTYSGGWKDVEWMEPGVHPSCYRIKPEPESTLEHKFRLENLVTVLSMAIHQREEWEKKEEFYDDSCMLIQWKQCRDAIREGKIPLIVK